MVLQIKMFKSCFQETLRQTRFDFVNGVYSKEDLEVMNVKDEAEVRLCVGVAAVQDTPTSPLKGKRCDVYHYFGKIVKSIPEHKNLQLKHFEYIQQQRRMELESFNHLLSLIKIS